jgi:alkylation response protein AidB-like acyl-CoA dehydrogenase
MGWYARGGTDIRCVFAEHITFQMTRMTYKEMSKQLAGCVLDFQSPRMGIYSDVWFDRDSPISFLKMTCTQMAQETAKDAVQIYGGRGMLRSGG